MLSYGFFKILPLAAVIVLVSMPAHAQCRYGSQCGRTIYEESARQREHDQYISSQNRASSRSSSYTSNSTASSGRVYSDWSPSRENYSRTRESNWGEPVTIVQRQPTQQDYFEMVKREVASNKEGAKDRLALAYYWGDGTPVNKLEAFRIWKELGAVDADALMTAAGMLYGGDGIKKDEEGGLRMAREAAARGNSRAKAYFSGATDTPETVEASRKKGDYLPMARYGWRLLYGANGYAKDEAKGLAYIKAAAEVGQPQAETYLGFAYMFGDGTESNNAAATSWFLKAAAHKQDVAAYQLAWLYAETTRPGGPDVAAARRWSDIALAKEPKNPENLFQRASIELAGKDEAKARMLFLQAGELGDMKALGQAAIMEWRGVGGPADFEAGYRHMLASVTAGEPVSAYEMGTAYQNGKFGLAADPPHATELFQKAAEKGLAQAQQNLAMAYYRGGRGVPQDNERAATWALKAAEAGWPNSEFMIAVFYQDGSGVPKDPEKAMYWMKKAANDGDANAKAEIAGGFNGR